MGLNKATLQPLPFSPFILLQLSRKLSKTIILASNIASEQQVNFSYHTLQHKNRNLSGGISMLTKLISLLTLKKKCKLKCISSPLAGFELTISLKKTTFMLTQLLYLPYVELYIAQSRRLSLGMDFFCFGNKSSEAFDKFISREWSERGIRIRITLSLKRVFYLSFYTFQKLGPHIIVISNLGKIPTNLF